MGGLFQTCQRGCTPLLFFHLVHDVTDAGPHRTADGCPAGDATTGNHRDRRP